MLKPNSKSLLPDRFSKRIISEARIIFAAYIIEECQGIGQEMELGQKPIYGFCGTLKKKEKEREKKKERERSKVLLKILSSTHSQASIKHCRLPSARLLNLKSLKV